MFTDVFDANPDPAVAHGSLGALVLAGGRSRRMGRDKAKIVLADDSAESETLLARTVRVALEVAAECVVVLAPEQPVPELDPRARVVRDPTPHEGPIAALAHAIHEVCAPWVLVLATDHPRLSASVLTRLAALADGDGAAFEGEPFVAVYRTEALRSVAQDLVREGERRARTLLERIRVRQVRAADLLADPDVAREDPSLESLVDVDTPEDLLALTRR